MTVRLEGRDRGCRLIFDGKMTKECQREMEDRVIEALRRYRHFEVDLSGVCYIDAYGKRLLNLLKEFGGNAVEIIACSTSVEQALGQQSCYAH
ncbi:MAG TPA: hypothetical protein VFF03_09700 [Rhodocyclaceae bacterium]|nr:hypothetical protein [Rhodocyclaceae bacterium]